MSGRPAAGSARPCAPFATCAEVTCGADATVETLHRPSTADQAWVPLCEAHRAMVGGPTVVEYVVEVHGFIPAGVSDGDR